MSSTGEDGQDPIRVAESCCSTESAPGAGWVPGSWSASKEGGYTKRVRAPLGNSDVLSGGMARAKDLRPDFTVFCALITLTYYTGQGLLPKDTSD